MDYITIGFYLSLLALAVIFRKKMKKEYEIHLGKYSLPIIMLMPLNFLKSRVTRFSQKHTRVGRFMGTSGLVVMFFVFLYGLYIFADFAFLSLTSFQTTIMENPQAQVAVLLPGISIPLVIGMIALIYSLSVHEFSHALVGISFGYKLKEIGIGLFTILPVAYVKFVGEQKWAKKKPSNFNKFIIAGCFANFLSFLLFLGVLRLGVFLSFPYVLLQLFSLTSFINLALGIVNVMPLFGITDGSQILGSLLEKFFKSKTLQSNLWALVHAIVMIIYFLPIVLILLFKGV